MSFRLSRTLRLRMGNLWVLGKMPRYSVASPGSPPVYGWASPRQRLPPAMPYRQPSPKEASSRLASNQQVASQLPDQRGPFCSLAALCAPQIIRCIRPLCHRVI
jgi:hypothetical protein